VSADRESIIRDVARTLFVMAWADGVEAGEIDGEGPGAGGDWVDAAPRTWAIELPCVLGGPAVRVFDSRERAEQWAQQCGRGELRAREIADPEAEAEVTP
jgi:hypothetical protein